MVVKFSCLRTMRSASMKVETLLFLSCKEQFIIFSALKV